MSVSITYNAKIATVETLPGNTDSAVDASRQVTHTQFDVSGTLSALSTPPCTQIAASVVALSAGAKTIDLRNLVGTNAAAVDCIGLKPQIVRIKNLGANTMTFSKGASNGHNLFTDDGTVVQPGGHVMLYTNDNTDDVDNTHKTWDVTGTGSQTFQLTVIAG